LAKNAVPPSASVRAAVPPLYFFPILFSPSENASFA
jgi:hypothetical protein